MKNAARAALRAFDAVERWIAERPWEAVPGGWLVLEQFAGWRFRLKTRPDGLCVPASNGWNDRAVWLVPA